MTERTATPFKLFSKASALLAAMVLLGVMASSSGAAEGDTTLVSLDGSGNQAIGENHRASISADGRFVAFASEGTSLVNPEVPGVFVHDRQTGTSELVSVDSSGNPADGGCCGSSFPSISPDGRFVAFRSWASNLVANDTNNRDDVFVHDRQTGTTERVSVSSSGKQAKGVGFRHGPSISADGRFVAFGSHAPNLVGNDTNGEGDIFVHDRQTGTTERVSVDGSSKQANGSSKSPSISADGRFVTYHSRATNLVANDTNERQDIFVRDRESGTTRRVSVSSSGNQADFRSVMPSISAGGRFVAFISGASNLVANDTNEAFDIFVRDRQTGTTRRVSVNSSGEQSDSGSCPYSFCGGPSISPDGRFVAFWSHASNLVANDTNGVADVFVRDRQSGTTRRVSVDSSGNQANSYSTDPSISSNGSNVAFSSNASNLLANDTNNEQLTLDVFVHELDTTTP